MSFGLPSPDPDEWRADVLRAKSKIRPGQVLLVSVIGTPAPGGDAQQLAEDYARCAKLGGRRGRRRGRGPSGLPSLLGEQPQMMYENPALSAYIVDQVRRAVGQRPVIAKLGATRSPRALHELASRLAPRLDGFILVSGLHRKVVKRDGTPAFAGESRSAATVVGAGIYDTVPGPGGRAARVAQGWRMEPRHSRGGRLDDGPARA